MEKHIKKTVSRKLLNHLLTLRNIAKIRKYFSQKTFEIFFHAFISSKGDSCNSYQQFTAATRRVITHTKEFDQM